MNGQTIFSYVRCATDGKDGGFQSGIEKVSCLVKRSPKRNMEIGANSINQVWPRARSNLVGRTLGGGKGGTAQVKL